MAQNKTLILHVEDEPDIRKTVQFAIKKYGSGGFEIIEAANGEEGIEIVNRQGRELSLMIADLYMPKIMGTELIAYARSKLPSLPIIVFTGHPEVSVAISLFRDNRISDFLVKPVEGSVIARSIENCLSRKEQNPIKRFFENVFPRSEGMVTTSDQPSQVEYKTVIAGFAHDLKNEFSRLSDACRSLIDQKSYLEEDVQKIQLSVEYSQLIHRRMLDYLDLGSLPAQPTNVLEVIRKAEDLIRPRLESRIEFTSSVDPGKVRRELRVLANPDQLLSILIQLIRNAEQALGSKSGTINLKVQSRYPVLAISVSDTGPGIPVPVREKLFKSPLPRNGGLGLGLFLAQKIVTSWNGQIYIENTGESGTTITISLPIHST
jgi:signal transduction histidine kinase